MHIPTIWCQFGDSWCVAGGTHTVEDWTECAVCTDTQTDTQKWKQYIRQFHPTHLTDIKIAEKHLPLLQAHCLMLTNWYCKLMPKFSSIMCNTHTHTTILQLSGLYPGQPGWAGTRRNIHLLTPIMVISHPLSASSIYHDSWHSPWSIYVPDSLFPQSLSKFSCATQGDKKQYGTRTTNVTTSTHTHTHTHF